MRKDKTMKRILVIDGNSIINRAYYGMRPLTTKSGKTTHAVYGMINIISRQLAALKPDYAAVAFDLKAPTFRHKLYSEYKAGRHATPEDLLSQFPDAKECMALMGLKVMEIPGYEADDIQGTVAKLAHSIPDCEGYVLSGDRDLLQLIDDKVTVLLATNSETKVMRREEFIGEYGIEPSLFVDMKALMGDSSDNIPGVAGIGKKTAEMLISNFKTLEGIYESLDDKRISKGVREKLEKGRESAFLSRTLSKINTETPLGCTLDELSYKGFDNSGLYRKFTELELNSLIAKFGLSKASSDRSGDCAKSNSDSLSESENSTVSFEKIDSSEILKIQEKRISVEILNGILYISCEQGNFSYDGELSKIRDLFEDRELICHEGKALWHILRAAGCELSKTVFLDLSMYAYVLNPGSGAATVSSLHAMFTEKIRQEGSPSADLFSATEAAMRKKIDSDGLSGILFDIEIPLINILAETEEAGFKIDPEGINEFSEALCELSKELTVRIYMQA